MPSVRRKHSAALRDFRTELDSLERFDAENQAAFSAATRAPGSKKLPQRQLHLLTEAIFFAGFRAYESFVRDVFLLYCMEKKPPSGAKAKSFIKPKNFNHAEDLIQSSMRFLDWTQPDKVIQRAELYLDNGFPVKLPYTTNLEVLRDFKRIRNHIAHDSKPSLEEYRKVLRKHYRTIPLTLPSPGEFLLVPERHSTRYKLLTFFDLMKKVSNDLT